MPHPFLARQTALVFSVHEVFALQSTFLVVPLVLAPAYIGLDTQSPAFYFVHKVSEFLPVLFGDKSTTYVQLNQSALFATHLLKSFLYFSRSLKYQFQSSALLPV